MTSVEPDAKRQRATPNGGGAVDALSLVAVSCGVKGRKHTMEDVPLLVDELPPAPTEVSGTAAALPPCRRAFYAVFDGHGGRQCAVGRFSLLPTTRPPRSRCAPSRPSSSAYPMRHQNGMRISLASQPTSSA